MMVHSHRKATAHTYVTGRDRSRNVLVRRYKKKSKGSNGFVFVLSYASARHAATRWFGTCGGASASGLRSPNEMTPMIHLLVLISANPRHCIITKVSQSIQHIFNLVVPAQSSKPSSFDSSSIPSCRHSFLACLQKQMSLQ